MVHVVVRLVLLLLCASVAVARGEDAGEALWALPLGLAGLAALAPAHSRGWVTVTTTLEGAMTGLALVATGSADSPYLPYLIAPAFSVALTTGLLAGALPLGSAAAVVLLAPVVDDAAPTPLHLSSEIAQWFVLAGLVVSVAAWVRSVSQQAERVGELEESQLEAFRLLTALREVTRQLPGTLDPTSTGEAVLDRARGATAYDTGAVLVSVTGSHALAVLARQGQRPQWDLSRRGEQPLNQAWSTQQPSLLEPGLPRLADEVGSAVIPGATLLVPLVAGGETFAVILLEGGRGSFTPATAQEVRDAVRPMLLPLRSAVVFDEVRELATREERSRLAREIHDGIAQELASLGYALDGVAADLAAGSSVVNQVDDIRDHIRTLITELRMSLYDLRSDVSPDEGLGAAVSRHVRAVGSAAGMRVHLSLDESPVRLGAETEAELLRIVQEAVANARKHAHATNLWVTCTVDPPNALITVEDDGAGLVAGPAPDSYGLAIMRERAARVRAELVVENRAPQGTRVRLSMGRVPA
jgi:signal transduction histidine kinase